jgi:hypothetical protein
MRFTLLRMLVAVAMIALACAGLIYHTLGWTSVVVTATVALFFFMALRSLGQEPQERAFCLGFATVGGAYLFLATTHISSIRESLCTNYPLAFAAQTAAEHGADLGTATPIFFPQPVYSAAGLTSTVSPYLQLMPDGSTLFRPNPTPGILATMQSDCPLDQIISTATSYGNSLPIGRLFLIGHCVWSWLFALAGGWFAARMIASRRK